MVLILTRKMVINIIVLFTHFLMAFHSVFYVTLHFFKMENGDFLWWLKCWWTRFFHAVNKLNPILGLMLMFSRFMPKTMNQFNRILRSFLLYLRRTFRSFLHPPQMNKVMSWRFPFLWWNLLFWFGFLFLWRQFGARFSTWGWSFSFPLILLSGWLRQVHPTTPNS
jgi:hypothetical protein